MIAPCDRIDRVPAGPITDLSLGEARRVALAAQGFDRPRLKRAPGPRDLARVIRQLGLL